MLILGRGMRWRVVASIGIYQGRTALMIGVIRSEIISEILIFCDVAQLYNIIYYCVIGKSTFFLLQKRLVGLLNEARSHR